MPSNKRDMTKVLTHKRLLESLSYAPETGVFSWRQRRTHKPFPGAVSERGELIIGIDGRTYSAHRLAWFYAHKVWPDGVITPLDGDYLNLKLSNLKHETRRQASRRRVKRAGSASGLRGVSWSASTAKWLAQITIDGRTVVLGRFDVKEDASAAYEAARLKLYGITGAEADRAAQNRRLAINRARYAALWKRVVNNAGGITGWVSVGDFAIDLSRVEWEDDREIAPIDMLQPIGPQNWKWEDTLWGKFDFGTEEGKAAYKKAHREAYPMLRRAKFLQRQFGLPLAEYMRMHAAQAGLCGICNQPETETRNGKICWLAVDHCHSSGEVRGLLCGACNKGIGQFGDDPARLRAAADYLERHAAKRAAGAVSNVIPLKKPGAP